ncbi:SEC-C domain-containing protein [Listeria monocytogenes]|nr:SEC-C domain-containing protein [Listeria monocytogenes]
MEFSNKGKCWCGSGEKYKNCCKDIDNEKIDIFVRVENGILLRSIEQDGEEDYLLPTDDGIKTYINLKQKVMQTTYEVSIKSKTLRALESKENDLRKFENFTDKEAIQEIKDVTNIGHERHDKLIKGINVFFDIGESKECMLNSKDHFWSQDKENWLALPVWIDMYVTTRQGLKLTSNNIEILASYVKGEYYEPLVAMDYLFRAKNSDVPKFKWIDATIAAEFAIKEFYSRKIPQIETLLLEMPSPPLTKLYGKVMESLIGVKSPKVSEINKGIEIRNKLIHSPKEIDISLAEADKYINDIQEAIIHLLENLYGEDEYYVMSMKNKRITMDPMQFHRPKKK